MSRLVVLLLLAGLGGAAKAESGPDVSLASLLGQDTAGVHRMVGEPGNTGTPPPGLVIASPDGPVAVHAVWTAPEIVAGPPGEADQVCRLVFGAPGPSGPEPYPDRSAELAWVFQNGRLIAATAGRPGVLQPRDPGLSDMENLKRAMLGPKDAPLAAGPGELPLADGAGFLRRRPDLALPPETSFRRVCRPHAPGPADPSADRAARIAELALMPLALALPGLNRERREARSEGVAAMRYLALGQVLPGGAEGWAKRLRGAYVLTGERPGYRVVVVNLGAEPSRNLARMNHAGLIGVREGRVVWIARTDYRAPLGVVSALCLDRRSMPGRVRRGCTSTGFFSP